MYSLIKLLHLLVISSSFLNKPNKWKRPTHCYIFWWTSDVWQRQRWHQLFDRRHNVSATPNAIHSPSGYRFYWPQFLLVWHTCNKFQKFIFFNNFFFNFFPPSCSLVLFGVGKSSYTINSPPGNMLVQVVKCTAVSGYDNNFKSCFKLIFVFITECNCKQAS